MKAHTPVKITCEATIVRRKDWLIIVLPSHEDNQLPSRGQVSATVTINDIMFVVVLEPDGRGGHWFHIVDEMQAKAGLAVGDEVTILIETSAIWSEPIVPDDVASALDTSPRHVQNKWRDLTPMARWEWVRWVKATNSSKTRAERIAKTISKLHGSHRRPCCFNLAACTEPYLAKAGRLIEPSE